MDPLAGKARQGLDVALFELATQGRRPPCAEPGQPDPFSIHLTERAKAATLCTWCPIARPCAVAGEHEEHGVWGGHDRTPKLSRRPEKAS